MSIDNSQELQYFNKDIFPIYLNFFRSFGSRFSISDNVDFNNDVMTIEFLTYKFVSKHELVFKDGEPRLRVKFETTTIDDVTYFFDIYFDQHGRFDTRFSEMLNGYDMEILRNVSSGYIDKYIADLMFNFFRVNKIS
ncbi:hypothetical protein CA162_11425 [Vibrio parahaemolyticus]|nr:hypothetical protein CA162_11425 [Vibrio parahaemolyticus]